MAAGTACDDSLRRQNETKSENVFEKNKSTDCLIICSLTAFISVVGAVSLRIVGQDGGLVASDQEEGRHVGR
jgi:hypothetical protein